VERSSSLPGSSGTHVNFSEHTETWYLLPDWATSDTYVAEADDAGALTLEHTIGGTFGELAMRLTEGKHDYNEWVQDGYLNTWGQQEREGEYSSWGTINRDIVRSGTVTSQYDPAGKLLATTGQFRHEIESQGEAAASDWEQAKGSNHDWRATRTYNRDSEDYFNSFQTRVWTPGISGAGELEFQRETAAEQHEQEFWGNYTESDTRSVWDGYDWRLQQNPQSRAGNYFDASSGSGSAGREPGFSDEGFASWGYEGKSIHARYDNALGPASAQSPAFWDDYARPDMGAGPSLLRQDGGGGGLDGGGSWIDHDQQIAGLGVFVPPEGQAEGRKAYQRVEYSTWKHYASWYATAYVSAVVPPLGFVTEAGGDFWSGLFRTSDDVSSEFYAVSNGITRVSGTAFTLLLFPWSASSTLSMTLGGGAVLWGLDQTVTGGYELATGQEHHTFGGQALSKVFGETAGNLLYDWGPPTTATLNVLRNAAGWFRNILRNPSKLADEVVDLADEAVAPNRGFALPTLGKSGARELAGNMGLPTAQAHAVNRAIGRATSTSGIKVTQNGPDVLVEIFRKGDDGFQVIESIIRVDGTKTVVQKAYDALGNLVHFHPK
jgi:hypothetical protein